MKSLFDYDVSNNEVFYKCWHILEWIEKYPDMSLLDREAIMVTIMDALVYKGLIDSKSQSLDFDNLCIMDNLDHYVYEEHPNICGIPLFLKEKFRSKSIVISGSMPVSMFLAKPPSKFIRYCVYDPNLAVSSVFSDATFYDCLYDSPTRKGVRISEVRPFVEVCINGELYLVDTITKRILRSSWFKEKYNLEVVFSYSVSELEGERKKYYDDSTREDSNGLSTSIMFLIDPVFGRMPEFAEMRHEIEESKKYFPSAWKEYNEIYNDFLKRKGT